MKPSPIKFERPLQKYQRVITWSIGLFIFFLILSTQIPPRKDARQKSYLGQAHLPRGIRNNNPGNLRYSPLNNWKGKIPISQNTDGAFEQFIEWRYGIRALLVLLKGYIFRYGTIEAMLRHYAPSNENNTELYIQRVASDTGIPRNQVVTSTRETLLKLAISISRYENGKGYEITETDFQEAYKIM
ncbi:structural protein [Emticicia sp. BO119]|uniref:structural protein n=1 Tax=Emticicia sp. BO119 TaxID=2757768 RepID=UPI0015EFE835|nr:structural protein [Emticicia sp. BO119]MBA4849020.1 structural protein [Emticicia sp. BO119]